MPLQHNLSVTMSQEMCVICSTAHGTLSEAPCSHRFHLLCLLRWNYACASRQHPSTCPICRAEFVDVEQGREEREMASVVDQEPPPTSALDQALANLVQTITEREDEVDLLIRCISSGDLVGLVRRLRQDPSAVTARRADGTTALHHAVCRRNVAAVDLLLDNRANALARTTCGLTPLHLACVVCSTTIAKKLFARSGSVEIPDFSGETPLFIALRNHDACMTSFLLRHGACVDAVNLRHDTVAHIAAASSGRAMEAVLSNRPQMDAINYLGDTPLHIAASTGNAEFLRTVIPHTDYRVSQIRNHQGKTALDCVPVGSVHIRGLFTTWRNRNTHIRFQV